MSDGLRIAPEFFERTLASTEPSEALHQLDSWWSARAGRSVEQRHFGLSQTEFDVHLYLLYLGEVGNGGHSQFFLNPTDAREAVIDQLTEAALLRWSALDEELYEVDQASWGQVLEYVARHRDEVLVQERGG